MKICIVGGAGYIGKKLIEKLSKDSTHKITVIDKSFDPTFYNKQKCEFIIADITKKCFDCKILLDFDIVINLAGITMTYSKDEKSVMEINYEAAVKIAKFSKRYVFISTNNVFGGFEKPVFNVCEEHEKKSIGVYAKSKSLVEDWLKENHDDFVVLRLGSVYGFSYGMKYSPIANVFMLNSLFKKPITVYKEFGEPRPFVSINDVCRAIIFIVSKVFKNEFFHVVGDNYTLLELAEKIKSLKKDTEIVIDEDKSTGFRGYAINSDKIKKEGFVFEHGIEGEFLELKKRFKNVQDLGC